MKLVTFFFFCSFGILNAFSSERDSIHSLLNFENFDAMRFEEGVSAELSSHNGKKVIRIETAAAPTLGPAAYLATVRVKPGKQYTYFLTGYRNASCRVLLYVTSPKGNVLWPGSDIEQGVSQSVFTVPEDISEVSLAISFLYPEEPGAVLVEDITLVENKEVIQLPVSANNLETLPPSSREWVIWVYLSSVLILGVILYFTNRSRPLQDIFIKKQK